MCVCERYVGVLQGEILMGMGVGKEEIESAFSLLVLCVYFVGGFMSLMGCVLS